MGNDFPLSSIIPDFEGLEITRVLPRQSHSHYSRMAQPIQVSSSHGKVNPSFSIPKSPLVSADQRMSLLRTISSILFLNYVDFMKEVYSLLYSPGSTNILVQALRCSTTRQYDSAWLSFCNFLHSNKPSKITTEIVLSFLRFLLFHQGLALVTITALAKLLETAFGMFFLQNLL